MSDTYDAAIFMRIDRSLLSGNILQFIDLQVLNSMLDAIRKRSGSIVVKVLLLLLVLSFGAWGISDYITGGISSQAVAKVGEREISPQVFSNEYQREVSRMRQVLGGNLDSDMARMLGIPQNVLNRLIRTETFAAASGDLGLLVTDAMVLREIQSMEAFRGLTGNFDKDTFQQVIYNAGYTEDMFVALMKRDLSRGFLLESFQNGVIATDTMVNAIYGYREETRSAEIVIIPDDAFIDVPEPTDSEIAQYHQENQDRFMAPDYRSLSYIHLSAKDLSQEIAVSDEEILDAYEAREGEFVTPASRRVQQAIFDSADAAEAAIQMIATTGRAFVDVAAELTGASPETMELGWVGRGDFLSAELADAAYALESGGTTAAIESPLGWHVIHVVEANEESRQSLDEVRDRVRDDVALEKAIDSLFTLANALEDEMGGGATLEEAAQALDLSLGRIDGVDSSGLDANGVSVAVPTDNFLQVAFSTPEGEESSLSESTDDSYFIVRVDTVTPSALRPLNTVQSQVRDAILEDRRRSGSEDVAKRVVEIVNGGQSLLNALAQGSAGFDTMIMSAPSFKRNGDGAPPEMPAALSAILFERPVGQAGYARAGEGIPGFVVGRVSSVTPADPASDRDGVEAIEAELAGSVRADLMDQFALALQDTYSVTINNNVLDQLFENNY